MEIKNSLSIDYTVNYLEPEKTLEYLRGEFSRFFWDCDSLEQAAKFIASNLYRNNREIEGFGEFIEVPTEIYFENKYSLLIGKIQVMIDFD